VGDREGGGDLARRTTDGADRPEGFEMPEPQVFFSPRS
jgi:hypothetical protein